MPEQIGDIVVITTRTGISFEFYIKDLKTGQNYLGVYGLKGIDTAGLDQFIQQYAIESIQTIKK